MTESTAQPSDPLPYVVPVGLDNLTDFHRCVGCLTTTDWATYDRLDFMCRNCADHAADYPWRTTAGGLTP